MKEINTAKMKRTRALGNEQFRNRTDSDLDVMKKLRY